MSTSPVPATPVSTTITGADVANIENLILFGVQIFTSIFSLFRHPTTPVPVSAAPLIKAQLQATPGATEAHKEVIHQAVEAAVAAHQSA